MKEGLDMPTMDYKRFFATQREFDKKFVQVPKEERIVKKFTALVSETGETLNEKPSIFKYWSKKKLPSSHKKAEEYAKVYDVTPIYPEESEEDIVLDEMSDCWHYILSLGNELGVSEDAIPYLEKYGPVNSERTEAHLFMDFTSHVANLYQAWATETYVETPRQKYMTSSYVALVYSFMRIVGKLELGEKFEAAYYKKNGINLERQVNGY